MMSLVLDSVDSLTYVLLLSARGVTTETCQYVRDMQDGVGGDHTLRA